MKCFLASLRWMIIPVTWVMVDPAFSQSIPLTGTVAIQNSQYETGKRQYVKGASIRASFAKATTTDKQGQFALEFNGVKFGTPVRLSVSHASLTVVNVREMDQVIVGRKDPLVVVMADPDKLAEAQMKFYNIATTSIGKSFKVRMDSLRSEQRSLKERLAALEAEFGAKVADMNEAIELLTKQRDQALSRAQELANEFATVDLDGASELYIQAYKLFERGEIDSVLIVLNEERLQEEYQKAAREKAKGKRMVAEADTVISVTAGSYKLRADALLASGDHAGAFDQLLQLTRVHLRQAKGWDEEKLDALDRAVWLQRDSTGSHDLLLAVDSASISVQLHPPTDRAWSARLLGDRGLVLERTGDERKARDTFQAMLDTARVDHDTLQQATAHAHLARVLLQLRDRVIGRAHADSSLALKPNAEAHWIKYKEYARRNKRSRAVEHLASSLRLQANDPRTLPWRRTEALEAMRTLATRLEREDLLQEFDLR
ncbi:MAG TPA: hypothetical protein PLB89_03340 [Flavobacteriales bacterium]|nr:hypothetical protein [Flavobacteriales bacterium]